MKGKQEKQKKLEKCRICKKPEKRSELGGVVYSTLSPYGKVCVDCINAGRWP